MIKYKKGNLLDCYRANEINVIAHVANCQGVFGSGLALAIKNDFPEAYEAYKWQEKHVGLEL